MAKQVCDIKPTKGVAAADSKEQTRTWSQKQMETRLANKDLNYDFTRTHLNFEIVDGEVKEVDKTKLLDDSIRENLIRRGIPIPGEGKSHVKKGTKEPEKMIRNVAARMILGGSTARINQIAFGDQNVNFKKGSDNSHITRKEDIEKWAKDEFAWLENQFGKGCVARFIVHLDEGWVHAHATVIPTAIIKGRERVSWRQVFGGKIDVSRPKWKHIIDEHYNQVGINWGLERGDPVELTGAEHRSTRDFNKDLKKENAHLVQENATLTTDVANLENEKQSISREKEVLQQQYNDLEKQHSELSGEHAELVKQTDDVRENLAIITSRAEQLNKEMAKNIKAMKSLTSMIENKMTERAGVIQSLQTAQTQRDSGVISAEQYEAVVAETNAKLDEFDAFIKSKTENLTNVGSQLMEKQTALEELNNNYSALLAEVDAAKKFKKENDGLFRRFSSYIDNAMTEHAFLDVAKRLNAIPEGEKVEGLSELAKVLKTFAEGYPDQITNAKKSGYKLGYKARNTEIQPDVERLRSAVISLGAKSQDTQNMNLAALIAWLEELARRRQATLNAAKETGKAEGRKETIEDFIKSSGLNWKNPPTAESLGRVYREKWNDSKTLNEFEKTNGKLSELSKTFEGYENKLKYRDRKIGLLRGLLPTLDKAIAAVISLFHDSSPSLSLSMEKAEHIWRILSMASTREECFDLANQLVKLAKDEDPKTPTPSWVEDATQCVFEIVENVNPLAAIFSLLPDGASVGGGGGGNNDLPRKKDDDDDRRNKFNTIMGYSGGRKRGGYHK